jgi:MATE family multidrug resistance protein
MQFLLDLLGFSIFLLLVGRLGTNVLAATNIAFNINMIAFMPMVGVGIAVSILVGQNIGQQRPETATRATWSAFQLTALYMGTVAFFFVAVPELFLMPFVTQANSVSFETIHELVIKLLIFVAIYSLFDSMNIIFASALKGAGDTKFVMLMAVVLSWILMVIPTYISCIIYGKDIFWAWTFASLYISVLGLGFYFRFQSGNWKSMKVIEDEAILGI